MQQSPAPGQPVLKAQPSSTLFPATPEDTAKLPSELAGPGTVPPVVAEEEGQLRFIGSMTPNREPGACMLAVLGTSMGCLTHGPIEMCIAACLTSNHQPPLPRFEDMGT